MSFGFGVGDIVLVTNLAWKLYKGCKDSSQDFRRMSMEIASLHADRLSTLIQGCLASPQELEALYIRYESLSTQRQRTWDRMRFGLADLSEVRQRLMLNTTLLTSLFTAALVNACTARIEKRLTKFITEAQAGMREGSVISVSDVASSVESPEVWAGLLRELDDVGISAAIAEENREFIVNWFKDAGAAGLLDEIAPAEKGDIDDSRSFMPPLNESGASRSSTPTNDHEDFSDYHTAHSDVSDDNSVSFRHQAVNLKAATSTFDAEIQRLCNEQSIPGPGGVSSSLVPSSSSSRRPTFKRVERLFWKSTAIVQAASDGDIERVAHLISLGMDMNAVDQYGWSALSMCGYNGYANIARLLLDHGANLDSPGGDTPIYLAEQRGHRDVVIMLEEEAIRRLPSAPMLVHVPGPRGRGGG
ncbi:hypothetical protein C8R45DRAFT_1064248 [Mycena sanguinolenta]|nr:hypothetical protein C8R45DRAFT_1064248 [Mycena sanguinolenta]